MYVRSFLSNDHQRENDGFILRTSDDCSEGSAEGLLVL
jgi:hypothetical protein